MSLTVVHSRTSSKETEFFQITNQTLKTELKIQSQNKISKITNGNEIAFIKVQKYLIFMHLVSLRRSCCSIKSAIDQLLTLMLKLSNSHALKTIGKPLPIATRLSTFLQDGDGTAKKCQMKKWVFVFVCLLKWKTKTIFEMSIKSSITYQKHSEIQKIVGTLLFRPFQRFYGTFFKSHFTALVA